MNIEHTILVNQLAQGVVALEDGEKWFAALSGASRRNALREINTMVLQAHPRPEDAASAILASGLKATLTPCVLLSKPELKMQLAKLANLPEEHLTNVFKLLVAMLAIADKRRRETESLDVVKHWWHRNLGDPKVIEEIRRQYKAGTL